MQHVPLFVTQLRTRNLKPPLRTFDALFDLTHRREVLVEFLAVVSTQPASQ